MDGVTLLLQVITKMETPGRMPEPFTTDNKKYLHPGSCLKRYELITDEILPGSSQYTEGQHQDIRRDPHKRPQVFVHFLGGTIVSY